MTRDDSDDDFGRKYQASQFLEVVEESGPITTGEVSQEVGCHRNTARNQLERLAERNEIGKLEVGQGYIWQVVSE